METRLPVYKRILFLLILITGIALGIIFISPKFDGDIFLGISVGLIFSIILISILSPEVREMSKKLRGKNSILGTMKNVYSHPTQIPAVIATIWFIFVFFILLVTLKFSGKSITQENDWILIILLSPIFLLLGYSGFIMIKRKETVGSLGQIYKGYWAVFLGALVLVMCWGGFIFMILAYVFKW